jgi:hypothetical protein
LDLKRNDMTETILEPAKGAFDILGKAGRAVANGNYAAISSVAKEITSRLKQGEFYLSEPFLVLADCLANMPQYLPQAPFIYAELVKNTRSTAENDRYYKKAARGMEMKAMDRLLYTADQLPTKAGQIHAYKIVQAYSRPQTRPGSLHEKLARAKLKELSVI